MYFLLIFQPIDLFLMLSVTHPGPRAVSEVLRGCTCQSSTNLTVSSCSSFPRAVIIKHHGLDA